MPETSCVSDAYAPLREGYHKAEKEEPRHGLSRENGLYASSNDIARLVRGMPASELYRGTSVERQVSANYLLRSNGGAPCVTPAPYTGMSSAGRKFVKLLEDLARPK